MRFFIIFLISSIGSAAFCSTDCIGPETATKYIVYLHGMDTVLPSPQERGNRSILEELAKNLNIRFALPRATDKCPTNPQQICWTWAAKTGADLAPVKNAVKTAASDCFAKKNYTVIGFSNGGVAVTALLRLCERVDFKSAIVIGAAGGWFSSDPKTLTDCDLKLTSLLGSEDQSNQKPVRDLVNHLITLKASISLVEYTGGHRLVYEPLFSLLK